MLFVSLRWRIYLGIWVMAKVRINYEFDFFEEQDSLKQLIASQEAHRVLYDLDQQLRSTLKHDDSDWINGEAVVYLEHLRDQIADSGVLRDY